MVHYLPYDLLIALQNVKGFDEKSFISIHTSYKQVTSIRLNPFKNSEFITHNSEIQKVPWSTHGYYLPERPSFTLDPAFHAGAYYVQEASSMFLEEAVRQTTDLSQLLRVLDLCAAPGGKSTLLQSIISEDSLLVSNEIIKSRVNILEENMIKSGGANVVVTNNDPKEFARLESFFDVIVVDAPCSGSGLFRKDPEAINEWSLSNVEMCSLRQQRILKDIMASLKPGGILIYSTCSYSVEEDEAIADWIMSEYHFQSLQLQRKEEWNIVETISDEKKAFGYRFYPDKLKGEGFFIAAFRKQGGLIQKEKHTKNKLPHITEKEKQLLDPFVDTSRHAFVIWKNDILAFPENRLQDLHELQGGLYIKKAGIRTGSIKQGIFIPHHELAMSNILSADVPAVEVDLTNAQEYLRRHDVNFKTTSKGWIIIKYNGLPLGWIKNLENRANNYYPKEWRILNK